MWQGKCAKARCKAGTCTRVCHSFSLRRLRAHLAPLLTCCTAEQVFNDGGYSRSIRILDICLHKPEGATKSASQLSPPHAQLTC